jgi:hypothetical protein
MFALKFLRKKPTNQRVDIFFFKTIFNKNGLENRLTPVILQVQKLALSPIMGFSFLTGVVSQLSSPLTYQHPVSHDATRFQLRKLTFKPLLAFQPKTERGQSNMKTGVFSAYAQRYFELGMNVVPIGANKKTHNGFKWEKWSTEKQTQEDIDTIIEKHGEAPGIAIICGEVSNIVGFDFDYKFNALKMPADFDEKKYEKDHRQSDQMIRQYIPPQDAVKKAFEGWTAFYRFSKDNVTTTCDRNGVRLFDFKATGYIIMPPSFHSVKEGQEIYYNWINGDSESLASLESIPQMVVDELKFAMSKGASAASQMKNSRHGRIFLFGVQLCKTNTDDNEIAEALLEYDKKVNSKDPKGPYFEDEKSVGNNPLRYAKSWVTRIRKCASQSPKAAKPSEDVWDHFIQKQFFDIRKDILSKKIMTKRSEADEWVDVETLVPVLRAYAKQKGMPKEDVMDELARFIYENKKDDFLCDIPEWDGVDHVSKITSALDSPDFSPEQIAEIFKRWGARIFGRIEDSENQNECIILKGPQNIGKDFFIRSLLSGFKPYYKNVTPPDSKKDFLEIIYRLYVCHIEEFDQTGKIDVAFLKSLITQSQSFFREAYGRGASDRTMAASFISSVNPDDFLRDQTGNRRFIVIPLKKIKFGYATNMSTQILAQWKHLHQNGGVKLELETQLAINKVIAEYTPDDNSEIIEEIYQTKFKEACRANFGANGSDLYARNHLETLLTQSQAQPILKAIADEMRLSPNRVRQILKVRGYQRRDAKQRLWKFDNGRQHE